MKKIKLNDTVTITMYSVPELNKIKELLENNGYKVNAIPLSMDEAHLLTETQDK